MYYTVLSIQYLSILGLFIESWIVFHRWSTTLHSYLFFYCAANLVNNIGYLLELRAKNEGEFITALQLSYFGRVFIPYALMLFVMELCKVKLPHILKIGTALIHVATYLLMLFMGSHDLYYTDIEFVVTEGIPQLKHGGGPWYIFYNGLILVYIVAGMIALVVTFARTKNKKTKKCIGMVIVAMLAESGCLVISLFKPFYLAQVFDVTSIGYLIGTLFMLIAIFGYGLLGTEKLAKDYMIDRLSEGIVAADEKGNVAYFNKPAEALLPELSENASDVVARLCDAIEKKEPLHIGDRVYSVHSDTLVKGNEISGTVYVLQDNTEFYKHAHELEEMTLRANSANAAKSSFLSSMSHEIRTPINAVLGIDEMILRESRENEIRSYAQDIQTAGKTLLSLINDILDFSKIEEGKMEIIPEKYDVGEMINDIVNMVQSRADDKGLRLNVKVDGGIPRVLYGDEIRIKQCALNILTNAVKYTEKGKVDLTVGFVKGKEDYIFLRFTVKDTGIGMKQEDMEKLFSPFVRIEEKRNRSIEGTGLGMSITRQLLALMGSELEVKSEYGVGSEFSFAVRQKVIRSEPLGDMSGGIVRRKRKSYHELFRAPTAKVLVVDDNTVNLSVIKGLLKQTLVGVCTAESGKEALELAAKERFDVVFIDHMMPEMDGIETLHRLREIDGYSDTCCVALTANAVSGAHEMYLENGFSDYLSKPVDGKLLEEMLLAHLPAEKVTVSEQDGEDETEDDDIAALPPALYDISEIDPKKGLLNCGTTELYLDTMSVYAESAGPNADEIERLWKNGDTENAVIKIHALKSTSRIIGAESLGALAERLELAGKANELDTVASGIDELLSRYRGLGYTLGAMFSVRSQSESVDTISREELYDAYSQIREYVASFDDDSIGSIIGEIMKYELPEEEKEFFSQVRKAYDNFDWGTLNKLMSE